MFTNPRAAVHTLPLPAPFEREGAPWTTPVSSRPSASSRSTPAPRSWRSTAARTSRVRAKSDASPVTEADERADAVISRGPRGGLPGDPGRHRGAAGEPRRQRAGLLPRRPARRHQGVRAAPRRLHRQHRADRERRADPRRGLRTCAGPALLHRRRRPLAGGGRAARPRRPARSPRSASPRPTPPRWSWSPPSRTATRRPTTTSPAIRVADFRSAGSSLKFCLVAAGEADLYPRLGRTMEWDTAAGQAVLLGAGGRVVRFDDHAPLGLRQAGLREPVLHRLRPRDRRSWPADAVPVLLVIPARYASTRYPGKPLVELVGATGEARSLIRRSWEAAIAVPGVDRVVVATDDDRIADAARAFGAEVAMTPDTCRNGTERCAAGGARPRRRYDIVVNLQGDAPLTPPWFVSALVAAHAGRPGAHGGDPGAALRRRGAGRLPRGPPQRPGRRHHRGLRPRGPGALLLQGGASPIPAARSAPATTIPVFHHVGVYAYRRAALDAYPGLADRAARDLGGPRAAALHGERLSRCTASRWRPAAGPSGSSTIPTDVPRIEAILRRARPAVNRPGDHRR